MTIEKEEFDSEKGWREFYRGPFFFAFKSALGVVWDGVYTGFGISASALRGFWETWDDYT